MNKTLKEKHPYKIWYNEKQNRWYTYVDDDSQTSGRRRIHRNRRDDLEKYLIVHYGIADEQAAQNYICKRRNEKSDRPVYTINSLWTEFEQYRSVMQKANTVKEDLKAYKRFYEGDPIADRNLEDIKPVELEMWLQTQVTTYKLNKHSYSKLKTPFSQLYVYANRRGYISNNPFNGIDIKRLGLVDEKRKTGREKAFMREEQPDIFRVAWNDFCMNPYPVPIGVLLAFQTGLRIGELAALKWEDVDFEQRLLHVCRYEENVVDFSENFREMSNYHHVVYEHDTKGSFGERYVDLTDDAIYLLNVLRDYYKDISVSSPWMFYNVKRNQKCFDRAFDLRIRKYCRLTGINEKSMHKIRSTFISNLRDAGMSYERIAEYVGHRDVSTTQKHYSYDLESAQRNREIMNSLSVLRSERVEGHQRASKIKTASA